MANGTNGKKLDRGWLQTIAYFAGLFIAAGATYAALRSDVRRNCETNDKQDVQIQTNVSGIHRLETGAARLDEQYKAIQQSLQRIEKHIERRP